MNNTTIILSPESSGVLYDTVVCATEEKKDAEKKVNNTILDLELSSEDGDKIIYKILNNGMSRTHAAKLLNETITLPEDQIINDALNQLLDQHEQCKQDRNPSCDIMIYTAIEELRKAEHFILTTECDNNCTIKVIASAMGGAITGAAALAKTGSLIGGPPGAAAGAAIGASVGAVAGGLAGYQPEPKPEKPSPVPPKLP